MQTRVILAQETISSGPATVAYNFNKITQEEGLSSYNVKKIIQDSYGFIWIATQDGLNRYDGKKFIVYNKAGDVTRRLISNDIWDMVEDSVQKRLWVLTYSGLNAIDLATGVVLHDAISSPTVFPNDWLKRLLLNDGRLWIGTYDGVAVYNIANQSFDSLEHIPFRKTKLDPNYNVNLLYRDEYDRIWVFIADYGLVIYSGKTLHVIRTYSLNELGLDERYDYARFHDLAYLGNNHLSLATDAGLYDISYGRDLIKVKPFFMPGRGSPIHVAIKCCRLAGRDQLWFASDNKLYQWSLSEHRLTVIRDIDRSSREDWLSGIYSIFVDRQENLWLGTQKGAAYCVNAPTPFLSFFQSVDFTAKVDHTYYVCPYLGTLHCICAADGLYLVDMQNNRIRKIRKGTFYFAQPMVSGGLLVSSDKQLYMLRADCTLIDAEKVFPELHVMRDVPINSLVYSGDSLIVMGSDNLRGLFLWHLKTHQIDNVNEDTSPLSLANNFVNTVVKDGSGRMWILSNASFSIFDPCKHTLRNCKIEDPATHQPYTFYFDVAEAAGLYWLSVYGTGLIGLDSSLNVRKIISLKDGLPNAGVYKVFAWHDSTLFVTTNNGLAIVHLPDYHVSNYFRKDGLHSNSFEENCGYSNDRYIYAGGVGGFTRIEPGAIRKDASPPILRVGTIRLQRSSGTFDTSNLAISHLTIPSDVVQAIIGISAFNYTDGERTTLYYSIPELGDQWSRLGVDQSLNLLGLNPGKYTLQVRAINNNSIKVERTLAFGLVFLPKWYQTSWFKLSILACVLLLLYAFYRYRIHQLRERHRIRQNIASDLHDDIGSILNTVKIFTHMARKEPEKDSYLSQIETSLAQAVMGLRDMIWVLDDSLDSVFELLERIRQFALPVTDAKGIELEVNADTEIHHLTLSKSEKRNLLLIAKETINNSIKYAACTRIQVRISSSEQSLILEIRDNGQGFDTSHASTGYGLKNVCQRAEQIRYSASIVSERGVGTTTIIQKK